MGCLRFHGFSELGVFWDWASLWQKDPALYGQDGYDGSRTEEETVSFGIALKQTMDLWYAHQGTTVYMLTKLPDGATRPSYAESGWPTYERCCTEQIKKASLESVCWKLVQDVGANDLEEFDHELPPLNRYVHSVQRTRKWPVGPDDFDELIQNKQFTYRADVRTVQSLFRFMSVRQLGGVTGLNYTSMPAPSTTDAAQLGWRAFRSAAGCRRS